MPILNLLFPDFDTERMLRGLSVVPWRFTFVPAMLFSVLFVSYTISAARKHSIMAHPSSRGSHDVPTPRLGGLGIALSFYLSIMMMHLLGWWPVHPSAWYASILVGGAWALIGGVLDDMLELPPRWKFLFQYAAAGSVIVLGFAPTRLELVGLPAIMPWWLSDLVVFIFIVFFMNAFNFMDGMDGQASVFAVLVCLGLIMPLVGLNLLGFALEVFVLAMLAGAIFGFLFFNLPGNMAFIKSFMGDGGSQFIGFLLAVFCLRVAQGTGGAFPFTACLMLLSPFLWDVLFTLFLRTLRGENVFRAHRSHLYQRLLIAGWSHGRVLSVSLIWWLGAFVFAQQYASAVRVNNGQSQHVLLGGLGFWLVSYTLLVLLVEKQKSEKNGVPSHDEAQQLQAG